MKNLIILVAILLASTLSTFAGNYEETMGKTIAQLYQTQNREELLALGNTFDRIAQKESTQWLPYYYAAYSNLSVLFFAHDLSVAEKTEVLNNAQMELDKALRLNEKESEIYVLQAFIYSMRITDPSMGRKYSGLSNEALAKAQLLNPENPRYYYLKGTNLFHTPAEYGGGMDAAKPLFEKAAELFSKTTQKNTLMPIWGNQHNSIMLQQCN
ncbi:MAG: hypothetical protein ACERKD_19830 [Prolixibacteraceae bacterium]